MIQIFFTILEAMLMFATIICFFARNEAFFLFMLFTFALMISKRIMIKVEEYSKKDPNYVQTEQPIETTYEEELSNVSYYPKPFLNNFELDFLYKLSYFNQYYIIIPKINLGAIIAKNKGTSLTDLAYNIDFGIFTKDFKLLLLIELSDPNNTSKEYQTRDLKIQKILKSSNIKLVKFYTSYPNEPDYIIKRIMSNLS